MHLMKKALRITHLNLNGVHRAGVYVSIVISLSAGDSCKPSVHCLNVQAQADLREHADVVEYLVSSGQLDPCITEVRKCCLQV